jgi:oligogalacturonide lyase
MKGDTFAIQFQEIEDKGTAKKVTRITDLAAPSNHLYFTQRSFTPDGKTVVFLSEREGGFNLYGLDMASGKAVQITEGRNLGYFPFVGWGGNQVFFGDGSNLWLVDLKTLDEKKLLDVGEMIGRKVTRVGGTYQSYDGSRVVCFYESPGADGARSSYGLVIHELDNGESRVIVEGEQPVRHCQFCPQDSRQVLYAHEGKWETIQTRMWLVRTDGSDNHPVRKQVEGEQVGHEFWANKSKIIYFTIYRGETSEIRKMDLGTQKEELVLAIDNCHAAIDPSDRYIIADNNRGNANELFLIDLTTRQSRILCYPRMSWKSGRFHPHPTFSPSSDRVIYTSDFEGTPAVYIAEL